MAKQKQISFTKEQLQEKIRRTTITEIISALALSIVEHAINVLDEDLIDVAMTAQIQTGERAKRFTKLLSAKNIISFNNLEQFQIPPGGIVDVILIEDIYICKHVK